MNPTIKIPSLRFDPPGPGAWAFDQTHQVSPWPRLATSTLERCYAAGFRRGFREVGALLDTLELRSVHGWLYVAPRPVGAPPGAGGPPPKLIFKALVTLHPELRRRVRRAEQLWHNRPWQAVNRRWQDEHAPRFRRALEALQCRSADDGDLVADLRNALRLFGELLEEHFACSVRTIPPIGDFLLAVQDWAGTPAREAMRALAGASPETTRPRERLQAIAAAARAAGLDAQILDAARPAAEVLALLRAHAPAELAAYLDEYGWRIDNPCDEALAEHPERCVAGIRAALGRPTHGDASSDAEAVATRIRAAVPAEHRPDFDQRLREAREAGAWREDQVGLGLWAVGLMRRSAVAIGRQLLQSHRMAEVESALDCDADELAALLAGHGPTREAIAARTAARRAAAAITPPRHLGKPSAPPPAKWLPAGAARLMRAVGAFVARFDAEADERSDAPLSGHGVAPGIVEGVACVIREPVDLDRVAPGCIVVAKATSVAFNPVLAAVAGLVTERGGLVCHAAIVARELGIPGIVGCADAMSIPDGARIRVDGDRGVVTILTAAAEQPRARAMPRTTTTRTPHRPLVAGAHAPLIEAADPRRFGGKAAGLARAIAAKLPVPRGIALDPAFVEAAAACDGEHLARMDRILTVLAAPLAVRSSAIGEDGASASFAGIHHTSLGVAASDVAGALGEVWRSAHAEAALAYRQRRGLAGEPRMAAVVQEIVAAEIAGVMFGCDPVSGEDARVIEAAWGLGAVVVDGRVTPDRVRVDRAGTVIERVCGDKPVMGVLGEHGAREIALPHERATASCLDDALVRAIVDLGAACEELGNSPQDVEWAWAAGKLWLLQMRPITTAR